MPLHLDYRPDNFDDLVGNETELEALQAILKRKKGRSKAFLITGSIGCGKTTVGRIIAKTLRIEGRDLHELNAADFRGVDTAREIREMIKMQPMFSKRKAWMLDEVHKLTGDCQDALFKVVEEPPKNTYFILCTTNPEKLRIALRRRCTPIKLKNLTSSDLKNLMKKVAKQAGKRTSNKAVAKIVKFAMGSPGMALMLLDKVIDLPKEKQVNAVEVSEEEAADSRALCRALLQCASWNRVAPILKRLQTADSEAVRRQCLGWFNSVLVNGTYNETVKAAVEAFSVPTFDTGKNGIALAAARTFSARG